MVANQRGISVRPESQITARFGLGQRLFLTIPVIPINAHRKLQSFTLFRPVFLLSIFLLVNIWVVSIWESIINRVMNLLGHDFWLFVCICFCWEYSQESIAGSQTLPNNFRKGFCGCMLVPALYERSRFPISSPILGIVKFLFSFLSFSHFGGCNVVSRCND